MHEQAYATSTMKLPNETRVARTPIARYECNLEGNHFDFTLRMLKRKSHNRVGLLRRQRIAAELNGYCAERQLTLA
jgi:hypothetical protein